MIGGAARPATLLLVAAGLLAGCGGGSTAAPPPAAWRAAHPDPGGGVSFLDAGGVCVITVRYPQAAPGVIVVDMTSFVQRERSPRPAQPPPGRVVAVSADWTVIVLGPGDLQLLTADALFDYRPGTC